VGVPEVVSVGVLLSESEGEPVRVAEAVPVIVPLGVGVAVGEPVGLCEGVRVGVGLGDRGREGVYEALAPAVSEVVGVALRVGLPESVEV